MVRIGLLALFCAALCLGPRTLATPPGKTPDATIENYLLAQTALLQGEMYLLQRQPAKAVEVLEANLPYVNVNRKYMGVLRDAYRAYLNELSVQNQKELVERYQARLRIIENGSLATGQKPAGLETPPAGPRPPAVVEDRGRAQPAPTVPPAAAPAPAGQSASTPTVARGKADPFDLGNQQPAGPLPASGSSRAAEGLLARAEEEYANKRWSEARRLYDQAHRADERTTDGCRDRWAYCKLQHVVEQINNSGPNGCSWADLEKEVQQAMTLEPKLTRPGQWLLGKIEERKAAAGGAGGAPVSDVAVQHQPSTGGWHLAETTHFRIFHKQPREFADRLARVAERTRVEVSRKWFSTDGEAWTPKCEVVVHATAEEYRRQTGVQQIDSPGHSRIELDPSAGRVVKRRIEVHCTNADALVTHVLPHETAHVVLASQFGGQRLPRWADEGMAVLTEPPQRVERFRREVARCQRDRELFEVRELMQLEDYPRAQKINAFYAQSVSLVEYLARLRGPRVFAQFLRDGLRQGYEPALRAHYQIQGFAELQTRWGQDATASAADTAGTYAGR